MNHTKYLLALGLSSIIVIFLAIVNYIICLIAGTEFNQEMLMYSIIFYTLIEVTKLDLIKKDKEDR